MAEKDLWNHRRPEDDSAYAKYVNKPELQTLLPALYPTVFPHLKAYTKPRADLNAILLTGIPTGRRQGVPELHRQGRGGHAPAEPRDPSGQERRMTGVSWRATRQASRTGVASPTTW